MLLVVAYDISDDRCRLRVYKALKNFGRPVQYSTFECLVDPPQFVRLRGIVEKHLDAQVDQIAYYTVCEVCRDRIEVLSGTPPLREQRLIVV
jgi:CRISPR-associated protein Cas2